MAVVELFGWSFGLLALARGAWLVSVRSPAAPGWMALAALGAFALAMRVPATLGRLGAVLFVSAGGISVALVLVAGALTREAERRLTTADLTEADHLESEVRALRRRRLLRGRGRSSRLAGMFASDQDRRRVA